MLDMCRFLWNFLPYDGECFGVKILSDGFVDLVKSDGFKTFHIAIGKSRSIGGDDSAANIGGDFPQTALIAKRIGQLLSFFALDFGAGKAVFAGAMTAKIKAKKA